MKDSFGTNYVTGLNVAEGPHLISDDQLRESYGGWTDEDGVWRPQRAPVRQYHPYTAISCFCAGRMGGADHLVWLDGNTLYDNGVSKGTITAGSSMDIVALDDSFLILGAAKNYIWDGTHLREQGAWQPDYMSCQSEFEAVTASGWIAISNATQADPCVLTTASHAYLVGQYVYVSGVAGMTELNGKAWKVVAVGATSISLDVDSTTFSAYSAGGTDYADPRGGLVGDYKWAVSTIIQLTDGTVLEGKLREIQVVPADVVASRVYPELGPTDSWSSTAIALTADDHVVIGFDWTSNDNEFKAFLTYGATTLYSCSGTQGTAWIPGIRIYRTKANGTDFYLEREFKQGDTGVSTFSDATGSGLKFPQYYSTVPDGELGAVYEPGQYDHGSAPAATTGDVSAQRCLVNSETYPDRVYWSSLDGIEYFNTNTGWDKRPDTVTGIIGFRDGFVVFSSDRMWFMRIIDGLPDWEEIPTQVGTVWPKAMWVFDGGVVWLREDGLWSWGGAGPPVKVSWQAFADIVEPMSVTGAGDMLYVSGTERAYVALRRKQGWVWHECRDAYPFAAGTNGAIYAANAYQVVKMFDGVRSGGRLKSKHYGNRLQSKAVRVNLDFLGETVPELWINGNRQSDSTGHAEATRQTEYGRRIERVSVPRLNNQYVELQLEVTGDVQVYGWEVEAAR